VNYGLVWKIVHACSWLVSLREEQDDDDDVLMGNVVNLLFLNEEERL